MKRTFSCHLSFGKGVAFPWRTRFHGQVTVFQFVIFKARELWIGWTRCLYFAIKRFIPTREYLANPVGDCVCRNTKAFRERCTTERTFEFQKCIFGFFQFPLNIFNGFARGKSLKFGTWMFLVKVGANLTENLNSNILRSEIFRANCKLVGERRTEVEDLLARYTVPNRNNDPTLINFTADQSTKFTLWPRLPNEVRADDNNSKVRVC